MKTVGEIFALFTQYLDERKIPRARFCAQQLISHAMQIDKIDLFTRFDEPLEENELETIRSFLVRKGKGEPYEYITGNVEFYGCHIDVNPSVLIPRSETEIMLDLVCKEWLGEQKKPLEVWDLCTGSGCLAIAIKKKYPEFQVSASDLSEKALSVAKMNALKNEVLVEFYQGDLLTPFQGRKADLILCNPPYISNKEYDSLDPSVKDFEPALALIGGVSGLELYEKLSQKLPSVLRSGGKVCFEIGYQQGQKLLDLFSAPCWKQKILKKDWAGHDRFFFLEIE